MQKSNRNFVKAKVGKSKVMHDKTPTPVTKVMKVLYLTRKPEGKIATVELQLRSGTVSLTIDEPTARALAKIFD